MGVDGVAPVGGLAPGCGRVDLGLALLVALEVFPGAPGLDGPAAEEAVLGEVGGADQLADQVYLSHRTAILDIENRGRAHFPGLREPK